LKLEKKEFAVCSYVKGLKGSATPESFKRRAFWLTDKPEYIFVHYLDEAKPVPELLSLNTDQ
jgi:hypothetical protein